MDNKAEIKYDQTSYQREFQHSEKPYVYLSTGFGGGKTYALCQKGIKLAALNAGFPGGVVAPTIKMLKRDVVPTYYEIAAECGLRCHYKQDGYIEFPQLNAVQYVFHGEDHGASIRGVNLAYMLMNEVTLISKPTFDSAISRVRLRKAPKRQICCSGTPEGFNWAYEFFAESPRKDCDLIFGDARENKYVAPEYFTQLMESYDAKMVEQYIMGKFVNMQGDRAAWAFDRAKHCDDSIKKIPMAPIHVSLDFNVGVMAATLWNRVSTHDKKGKEYLAYESIALKNSNTYEMAEVLKSKVDLRNEEVTIYPDPAGASRTTKAVNTTDMDILREAGFSDIRFKRRIPSVKDCLNSMNGKFDKNKIAINHKACPDLVADLEQCIIKPGTDFVIDKANPNRSHWVDGFKNMMEYEFPILGQRGAREFRYR